MTKRRSLTEPGRAEGGALTLIRVSVPTPELDPLSLLRAFRGSVRGFWQRGDGWAAWAGRAAHVVHGSREDPFVSVREWARTTERRLRRGAGPAAGDGPGRGPGDVPPPRFYGGFAFDPGRADGPAPPWSAFPAALFQLPLVELRRVDSGTWLSVVAAGAGTGAGAETARQALERVRHRMGSTGDAPGAGPGDAGASGDRAPSAGVTGARSLPDRDGWRAGVRRSLEAIREGRLEKVVPARRVDLELAAPPDPVSVLRRLRRGAPATLPFLLESDPGSVWTGAAPEIVAACRDGRFHATAVAGTVADSPDPEERDRLARRLLDSVKDREEHEIGVRDMRRALLRVAEVAEVDEEPRVLRLRGMQHLLTNLSADVPGDLHVLDALSTMHPTAAVNGSPRAPALRLLRDLEPFARGWYAGPVGWFDVRGDGEFAPALRSVLLRGGRAHLFAGAGIVAGSDPDREWEETDLKLRPVLEGLGLAPGDPGAVGAPRAGSGSPAGSGAAG